MTMETVEFLFQKRGKHIAMPSAAFVESAYTVGHIPAHRFRPKCKQSNICTEEIHSAFINRYQCFVGLS